MVAGLGFLRSSPPLEENRYRKAKPADFLPVPLRGMAGLPFASGELAGQSALVDRFLPEADCFAGAPSQGIIMGLSLDSCSHNICGVMLYK
jgi:hypothetical protein